MSDDFIRKALGMEPVETPPVEQSSLPVCVPEEDQKIEREFNDANASIKSLIEKGEEAIDELMIIAKQGQHPRAFEVIGNLLKITADMNSQILDNFKRKKNASSSDDKPRETSANSPKSVTNNLFVGSTSELQNFLDQQAKNKK